MSRAICAAYVCAATLAHAEPRTDPTAGRAVFTGASTPSLTSIDVNPAALGPGTVDEIYVAGTLVADRYSIQRKLIDVDTGTLSPGPSLHDTEFAPGFMVAGVKHFKDSVAFAASLRSVPIEQFISNQPALAYYTLGGGERIWSATLGGAFKLTDDLYVGISLASEQRLLHLKYARDTALESGNTASDCGGTPCGVENPAARETYDINVNSKFLSQDAVTVNLGLVLKLGVIGFPKDWYIALAYHTTPGVDAVQNTLTGDMTVTHAPRDGGGIVKGNATVYVEEPVSVDAELRGRLAGKLDLHVGFRWEDLSRFAAYDVRGYGSTFPANNIPEWTERPRGFHDPFAVWAGVEQVEAGEAGLLGGWRFGGRIGIETAALDDTRTSPITIDPTSYTLDLGGMLRLTPTVVLQLTYGLQYYPAVHVTNSAFDPRDRLACIASGYDYATQVCESTRQGYAIPTAAGDYQRVEHAARFALRIQFP
jgi:hypothetical protein